MKDIVGRVPVNKQAAIVTSKGYQYDPTKIIDQDHWDSPPPTKPVKHNQPDLTGIRFGKLAVVGVYEKTRRGTKWVVRCSCGRYESRYSKAIKKSSNRNDMCCLCRHHEYITRIKDSERL